MSRRTSYPRGHWSLQVEIPYSMGVRQGDLVFLSGQADLEGMGQVCNAFDLGKQTAAAIRHIRSLFEDLDVDIDRLVKLTVYYVNNGEVDQSAYAAEIARLLGTLNQPVLAMVPVSHFFYPGALVEIDAVGVDSDAARHYLSKPEYGPVTPGSSQALRCGDYIFIGGITAMSTSGSIVSPGDSVEQTHQVLDRLDRVLGEFGAGREDVVKLNNWFVVDGNAEAWGRSATIRAGFYPEPGPVATGHALHSLGAPGVAISTDCWAMRSPDSGSLRKQHAWPAGHWDWPVHLPFKHGLKCGPVIFVGGQVAMDAEANVLAPGQLAEQTRLSMDNVGKVLAELGAVYADILKLNTWYRGARDTEHDAETLHTSVNLRSSYFQRPGPASTGIALDTLCYEGLMTETEVIAYRED